MRPERDQLTSRHSQQARGRHVLRAVLTVHPDSDALRVALRAGLTLAVPLVTLASIGRADLTLYPTFGAFAAVYGRGPSPQRRIVTRLQAGTWLTVCVTLGATVAISPDRRWLAIPAATTVAAFGTVLSSALVWHPPGALFAVFATAACASIPISVSGVATAFGLALGTVVLALMLDVPAVLKARLGREPQQRAAPIAPVAASAAPRPGISAAAVSNAALCAIAVACAGILAAGVASSRPYWAMVAAVAATAGPSATARVARGLQRVIGTVFGVVVAGVILTADPPVGVIVGLAVTFQIGAELLVGRNYALALVFITPLALLMVDLANPQPTDALLRDRILATVIGAACGIGITIAARLVGRRRDAPR